MATHVQARRSSGRRMRRRQYTVAVVGATGAVGTQMLRVLEERRFPVKHIRLLASAKSEGRRMPFGGAAHTVKELRPGSFEGVDIALFSAGASRSLEFAPHAVKRGAVVVDNSSAFRMRADVPLVIPEVNPRAVRGHRGMLAVPNCSTIIMLVALKPLHDAACLGRIVVSTYQSVSGAGSKAMYQLWAEAREMARRWGRYDATDPVQQVTGALQKPVSQQPILGERIAHNLVPQIGRFLPDGYTKEERKMREESRKILGLPGLRVSATCVRVPVYLAHSEAITAEFERPLSVEQARTLLQRAPGITLADGPHARRYPMPIEQGGRDEVAVGRIRRDPDDNKTLHLWVVGDNLRKGAATNAVQIAELLIGKRP